MTNFFYYLFGLIPPTRHIITPGQLYQFNNHTGGNPFTKLYTVRVQVIAVQNGWVNYRWVDNILWQNESMKVSSFEHCYTLLPEKHCIKA